MTRAQYAQSIVAALNAKHEGKVIYTVDTDGRKFARIARAGVLSPQSLSVALFVDDEGLVYKAAGWKAPAKGARFDVSTPEGLGSMVAQADPYGSYLYR